MPKHTQKYVAALNLAATLKIPELESSQQLYEELNLNNYFWDSDKKEWFPGGAPVPASDLIRLRVWSDSTTVNAIADSVILGMINSGFVLLEKSSSYVCRPPNQNESRIYLTFIKSL